MEAVTIPVQSRKVSGRKRWDVEQKLAVLAVVDMVEAGAVAGAAVEVLGVQVVAVVVAAAGIKSNSNQKAPQKRGFFIAYYLVIICR